MTKRARCSASLLLVLAGFGSGCGGDRPAAVTLGAVLSQSGPLAAVGQSELEAALLAIDEINAAGGLLGRQLKKVAYDTQSDMALYTKFGQQLARDDKVDVVHGGILSASRQNSLAARMDEAQSIASAIRDELSIRGLDELKKSGHVLAASCASATRARELVGDLADAPASATGRPWL